MPLFRRLLRRPEAYATFAGLYDLLSLEWPVYRCGRVAAIAALELRPGGPRARPGGRDRPEPPAPAAWIGPTGYVVAVDVSPSMLRQAARRVRRQGWKNVTLLRADAATVDSGSWEPVDAAIATYALSVIEDWPAAWRTMRRSTRPGGRIAVVDMQDPEGRWRVFRPPARWLCAVSDADIDARPWTALEAELQDVRGVSRRGRHI